MARLGRLVSRFFTDKNACKASFLAQSWHNLLVLQLILAVGISHTHVEKVLKRSWRSMLGLSTKVQTIVPLPEDWLELRILVGCHEIIVVYPRVDGGFLPVLGAVGNPAACRRFGSG